jgi:hypothetical protein
LNYLKIFIFHKKTKDMFIANKAKIIEIDYNPEVSGGGVNLDD